ncbi:hypothetical protein CDCA_CDCA18G4491 [Cyanidium caldarium]|uniref:Peptidase S54 rhomboid domain-containing protein n=1 Tax=Cyanidium caldarium TaxID=2771 RepID=A0AAV9J2E5_CYACA|nr:hypothetical protein CDCA_CDCA18G4491 [Cyanidium caldarium]
MDVRSLPIWRRLQAYPGTCGVIALLSAVLGYQNWKAVPLDAWSVSYVSVVVEREWWRVGSSVLAHASVLHLAMNLSALWGMRELEGELGTVRYLESSVRVWVLSEALFLLLQWLRMRWRQDEQYGQQAAVGYSGVLFGLLTLWSQVAPMGTFYVEGIAVPALLLPLVALLATQILVPQASLVGHVAGLLAGALLAADWRIGKALGLQRPWI